MVEVGAFPTLKRTEGIGTKQLGSLREPLISEARRGGRDSICWEGYRLNDGKRVMWSDESRFTQCYDLGSTQLVQLHHVPKESESTELAGFYLDHTSCFYTGFLYWANSVVLFAARSLVVVAASWELSN